MKISSHTILIILACIIVYFSACKQAPTLSLDNPIDPEAASFEVIKPYGLDYTLVKNETFNNAVRLEWRQMPGDTKYIDGYVISKSVTDSSINNIVSYKSVSNWISWNNEDLYRYYYLDQAEYNGIYAYYSVRSFYKQRNDTVYSEPISVSVNPIDYQVNVTIFPFREEPSLNFSWYVPNISSEANLKLYSKSPEANNAVLLGTLPIHDRIFSTNLNLDQNPNTEYYSQISLNNLKSSLQKVESHSYLPKLFYLDTSEFYEDQIQLDIGYNPDTSYVKPILETFQVRISESSTPYWDYSTDPDTSFVKAFKKGFNPPSEQVEINNLIHSKYYVVELFGERGAYKTETSIGVLLFDSNSNSWSLNTDPW